MSLENLSIDSMYTPSSGNFLYNLSFDADRLANDIPLRDLKHRCIQNTGRSKQHKHMYSQPEINVERGDRNDLAAQPTLSSLLPLSFSGDEIYIDTTHPYNERVISETCSLNEVEDSPHKSPDAHSGSSISPDEDVNETKRTKNARVAARCRHDNESTPQKSGVRERNRIAAAKHRVKKRAAITSMDEKSRNEREINAELKRQILALRNDLSSWRMLALNHISGEGGCRCAAIQRYNGNLMSRVMIGVGEPERNTPKPQMQYTLMT